MQAKISKRAPVINVVNEEGEHENFLIHELVENKKNFLNVFVQCAEYGSVYLYRIDIKFGIVDIVDEDMHILLHASPDHSAIGIGKIDDLDTTFRKVVEDALASYLSANIQNKN